MDTQTRILLKDKLLDETTSPDLFNLMLPDPYKILHDIFVNDDIETLLGLICELLENIMFLQIGIIKNDDNICKKLIEDTLPYNILLHFKCDNIQYFTRMNLSYVTKKHKELFTKEQHYQFNGIQDLNLPASYNQKYAKNKYGNLYCIQNKIHNLRSRYNKSNLLLQFDDIKIKENLKLYILWIIDFAYALQINYKPQGKVLVSDERGNLCFKSPSDPKFKLITLEEFYEVLEKKSDKIKNENIFPILKSDNNSAITWRLP